MYGEAKLDAPKLETVGGSVDVYGEAKLDALQTKNDTTAKVKCELALSASFKLNGLILIDGILSWILGEKTIGQITTFEIKIVGKIETSFAVKKGELFSHGETIEKAIEDLRYKIGDRDTSEFEAWKNNHDLEISVDDAIAAYRIITGACEFGTKEFVNSINLPEKLTPNVILGLTESRFGHDRFKSFLT